jgi:hypothetical protein
VNRARRVLRWYPPAWRERYGDELSALLDDLYGDGRVPARAQVGLARAAMGERLRAADLVGSSERSAAARAGALVVLGAWAVFVLAGSVFAKFAEHWQEMTAPSRQSVPAAAYDVVFIAAVVGAALVLAGSIVALPALVRWARAGGWRELRRPLVGLALLTVVVLVATAAAALWAHHLSDAARNGGSPGYTAAFLGWAALVSVWVLLTAATVVAVARRLSFGDWASRVLSGLAVALAIVMLAVAAAVVTWWLALLGSAPALFGPGLRGALAPLLVASVGAMALAVLAAGFGVRRVWSAWVA